MANEPKKLFVTDTPTTLGFPYIVEGSRIRYLHNGACHNSSKGTKLLAPILFDFLLNSPITSKLRTRYDYLYGTHYAISNRFFDRHVSYFVNTPQRVFIRILGEKGNTLLKAVYEDFMLFCSKKVEYEHVVFINTMFKYWIKSIDNEMELPVYDRYDPYMKYHMELEDSDPEDYFPETQKEKKMEPNKLFKYKNADGKEIFCSYLATDSTGNFVMEEKGTGVVFAVPKNSVEEVVPYTIGILWLTFNHSSTIQHYMIDKHPDLKENMVFMSKTGSIGIVKKLNTKSKTTNTLSLADMNVFVTKPILASDGSDTSDASDDVIPESPSVH